MTEADNIKFSKHKTVKGVGYQKYDNYNAVEVPYVNAIPSDYPGVMGVPISFLDKYSPEQFEIIGIVERGEDTPVSSYQNPGHKKYDRPYLNGQRIYARIFIKHRDQNENLVVETLSSESSVQIQNVVNFGPP